MGSWRLASVEIRLGKTLLVDTFKQYFRWKWLGFGRWFCSQIEMWVHFIYKYEEIEQVIKINLKIIDQMLPYQMFIKLPFFLFFSNVACVFIFVSNWKPDK